MSNIRTLNSNTVIAIDGNDEWSQGLLKVIVSSFNPMSLYSLRKSGLTAMTVAEGPAVAVGSGLASKGAKEIINSSKGSYQQKAENIR
ncbi:hypothetical protein [Robertmurraya massiliosenegalensis]|uniref:hypothetical protein n=1 Tax=Robertmurraya massiliosenegalensis TaxID=1287657 RepID=UPI0002DB71F2|nr:hypothetical protein [Robertmurraya massiliosenegalensis]